MKDYEALSKSHYDKTASYFQSSFDGRASKFFKNYIVKHLSLKTNEKILDVGCADGLLLARLKDEEKSIDGIGIDISSKMVKEASIKYPNLKFIEASAMELPFENESFDLLIACVSFHHFPNPQQFLKEAYRVLKPSGRIVIAEINILYPGRILFNHYVEKFSKEGDVRVYAPSEIRYLLRATGFLPEEEKTHFQIQYHLAMKD